MATINITTTTESGNNNKNSSQLDQVTKETASSWASRVVVADNDESGGGGGGGKEWRRTMRRYHQPSAGSNAVSSAYPLAKNLFICLLLISTISSSLIGSADALSCYECTNCYIPSATVTCQDQYNYCVTVAYSIGTYGT